MSLPHLDILEHSGQLVDEVGRHADLPQPLDHVLLLLGVGRRVEDESAREVRLGVAHEHVLVLHVLEDEQHFAQLGLHLVGRQLLAEGGSPEEHITVVGQQLWAL